MAFGNLPQIDPNFLMQRQANIGDMMQAGLGGYQQGLQLKQQMDAQKFDNALKSELATGEHDYTKPEGQASLIKALSSKGFGPEALKLASQFPTSVLGAKKEAWEVIQDENKNKWMFNKQTREKIPFSDAGPPDPVLTPEKRIAAQTIPDSPSIPPPTSVPWKGEKFVRSKDNRMVKIDANGNDQNGNPVEIWQKPESKTPPNTMGRDIPSLRTQSKDDAKAYTNGRNMLNAAEADYANYIKAPDAPTSRVHQQGIIDKYTNVSLNKSPTEAQLELAQAFPGIESWFDLKKGKILTGQIVPQGAIDEMMRDMRGTVINFGSTLKQSNARQSEAAKLGGIDPARVLNVPNDQITADSTKYANAVGMTKDQNIAKPVSRAERDKLPPGTKYIGPDGKVAIKQ